MRLTNNEPLCFSTMVHLAAALKSPLWGLFNSSSLPPLSYSRKAGVALS